MKSTKKSLLLSTLSLIMCVAMLLGTTYAWFTDSVTSGKNIITAGNLDIEMYYADGTKDPEDTTIWLNAADATIFNYELWEPGYTDVKHIKIANVGSLALKYQLAIVADGDLGILADVLDVYVTDTATQIAGRSDLSSMTKIGTLSEVLANASLDLTGNLMPAGTAGKTSENTLTIAVKMQEEAGNEYQKLSVANGFTVVVKATQYTYENDSFDKQYDKDSTYPEVVVPSTYKASTPAEITTAMSTAKTGDIVNLTNDTAIKLPALNENVTLKGNDPEHPAKINAEGSGSIASVPKGATFENLEFTFGNSSYHGFQSAGKITMKNCTLNGLFFTYGDMEFDGCTFNQETGEYIAWIYGAGKTVTFKNCTFNVNGKVFNVYNEANGGTEPINLTVDNCTFNSSAVNKAALNVKDTCGESHLAFNVTITNCTANENFPVAAAKNGKLWVIDPLVQVDDIKDGESKINITLNGTEVCNNALLHP